MGSKTALTAVPPVHTQSLLSQVTSATFCCGRSYAAIPPVWNGIFLQSTLSLTPFASAAECTTFQGSRCPFAVTFLLHVSVAKFISPVVK